MASQPEIGESGKREHFKSVAGKALLFYLHVTSVRQAGPTHAESSQWFLTPCLPNTLIHGLLSASQMAPAHVFVSQLWEGQ